MHIGTDKQATAIPWVITKRPERTPSSKRRKTLTPACLLHPPGQLRLSPPWHPASGWGWDKRGQQRRGWTPPLPYRGYGPGVRPTSLGTFILQKLRILRSPGGWRGPYLSRDAAHYLTGTGQPPRQRMTPSGTSVGLRQRNPASTQHGDQAGVSGQSLWVTPCPQNVNKPFMHPNAPPITPFEDGPCNADSFSPLAKDTEQRHSKVGGKRCRKVLEGKKLPIAQSRSSRGHEVLSRWTPDGVASRTTARDEDRPG